MRHMGEITEEMRDMEWSLREAESNGNVDNATAVKERQVFLRREFKALKLLERWEYDNGRIV